MIVKYNKYVYVYPFILFRHVIGQKSREREYMNKQLKRIISILCLMTMLFGNCSLDSLFGSTGHYAAAESVPVNPLERVDAVMTPEDAPV